MRAVTRIVVVSLLLLCYTSTGAAQPAQRVELQGTIQAVDCAAQQLTLQTDQITSVLQVTLASTIVVDGSPASLCSLQSSVGTPVTVSVVPINGQFMISSLRADDPPGAPQPASAPAAPAVSASVPPPILGAVLGTVIVAGLLYLVVQGAGGVVYRYPYYGTYYRTYYRPTYRPYVGPARPMLTYGPYRRCRDASWSQWCY